MSTSLLERPIALHTQVVVCPDPQCASPAHIEDRWTSESTNGPVGMVKVRCSASCWYTILADDLSLPPDP